MKKIVLQLTIESEKKKSKALRVVAEVEGVDSVAVDMEERKMTVIGKADPVSVTRKLRKSGFGFAELLSVEDSKEDSKEDKAEGEKTDVEIAETPTVLYVQRPYYGYSYVADNPSACTIC